MSERDKRSADSRLDKFRAMAAEAKECAQNAQTLEMRGEYENLVRAWEELIREMEVIGKAPAS
jgi:hypothetical protein